MDKVFKIENLSKDHILHKVSFEMEPGEMLAVMGPSGSGKSTLLYHGAGMDQPSGGRVWLGEQEITELSEDERADLRLNRMGFVFQQMHMVANLNILDNILLPAVQANKYRPVSRHGRAGLVLPGGMHKRDCPGRCLRKSKAELTMAAKELMQKMSISGLEERGITQVSGGQLQRACICRSMINCPEILFADEPTGALNKSAAGEVMKELVRLNQEGTAILMVTHDSKVASCCHRILYLLDGHICGELTMGRPEAGEEKRREEKVNRWLMEMGW